MEKPFRPLLACPKCNGDGTFQPPGQEEAYNCPVCHGNKVIHWHQYTLGFFFSEGEDYRPWVCLILKARPFHRPFCQAGLALSVLQNEAPYQCMVREFEEETSCKVNDWRPVCLMSVPDLLTQVYVYTSNLVPIDCVFAHKQPVLNQDPTERAEWFLVRDVKKLAAVPSLRWLIPLCLSRDVRAGSIVCNKIDPAAPELSGPSGDVPNGE